MLILGLSGPSAAGKTTLACELQRLDGGRCITVTTDNFFVPAQECPRFDLEAIPWPDGIVPAAFATRGDADTNVPAAVDWSGVHTAVVDAASTGGHVVIDSLLLLGDHPGARRVRSLCDQLVVLMADDAPARHALRRRKYARAHLGRPSYEQRGVSEAEYEIYFEHYVWPSWRAIESRVPPSALRLDCLQPTAAHVETLLSTGWFDSAEQQDPEPGTRRSTSELQEAARKARTVRLLRRGVRWSTTRLK